MRILHVYKDYSPVVGGIENHVRLLAEGQAAQGHDVTVLVTSPTARTTVSMLGGVTVIKAGRLAHAASTPVSVALPVALWRQHADITHLHFPYPPGEISQSLVMRRRPTVLSYHSDIVRQRRLAMMYRPWMMRILHRMDRILVSSPNYLATSVALAALKERCTVIPYGIDQGPFCSVPGSAAQRILDQHGAGPWILFVGVLRYYKGLHYLLEAMKTVPARLLIVGEGPEGPALRSAAHTLGVANKVVFAGRVSDADLPAYYHAADLFCLPASERSEAFGLVQVEALASGLPIVSTELGTGTSYVNKDGESGLVVPPRNAGALATALQALLNDTMLRQRLAAGARARAAAFTAGRMLEDVQAVYHDVLR